MPDHLVRVVHHYLGLWVFQLCTLTNGSWINKQHTLLFFTVPGDNDMEVITGNVYIWEIGTIIRIQDSLDRNSSVK